MKQAYIVAGLAFGDEGKGKMTDFLTRQYNADLVVRYNGGCQAAHNVISPEGIHHCFSQFGSGTLAGAKTHLSKYMLVEPLALQKEADILSAKIGGYPLHKLSVSPHSVIITPWHKCMNRMREVVRDTILNSPLTQRHGSVGLGVGEARMDDLELGFSLSAGQLYNESETLAVLKTHKLLKMGQAKELLRAHYSEDAHQLYLTMEELEPRVVARMFYQIFEEVELAIFRFASSTSDCVVFEGAQGMLLDETYGYQPPYVTWTDCSFNNANQLLKDTGYNWDVERIGVLRTYFTRHGAGPFPTEDLEINNPEPHNATHPWMGQFRQGKFDLNLVKHAIKHVGDIDCVALTHLDTYPSEWEGIQVLPVENKPIPIRYRSYGPTAKETTIMQEVLQ